MTLLAVTVDDRPVAGPPRATAADWALLRRIVAEAVLLQDDAEELLIGLRRRPDPSEVARPCGRLKCRFAELRTELPEGADPELERFTAAVRQVLDHHLLMLHTSVGLLSAGQRNDRLDARLDDIDGLGNPARRLDALRRELPPG